MNHYTLITILIAFLDGCSIAQADTTTHQSTSLKKAPLSVDFESSSVGLYNKKHIIKDWETIEWANVYQRTEIITDAQQGKVLRVFYPKGGLGPKETGGQFVVKLPPANQYTLTYKLKFEQGYDFAKGGKLPGLTSGGAKFTGGHHPYKGEGWSARFMWREKGTAEVYLYYVDMNTKWGERLPLESVTFKPGQWYELKQKIELNSANQKDAAIYVWVDGKLVMKKSNFRLRIGEQGKIDSLYFSTFFGGNSRAWVPNNDSYMRFDDFSISTQ